MATKLFTVNVKIGKAINSKTARQRMSRSFNRRARGAMKGMQNLVFKAVKKASPVVSGGTKESWMKSVIAMIPAAGGFPARVLSSVISENVSAVVIERGAKRHFPPKNALDQWIQTVLPAESSTERKLRRTSFAIRKSISQRGFPSNFVKSKRGKGVFARAVKTVRFQANQIAQRELVKISVQIQKGS